MINKKIAILGVGNMGGAIVSCLMSSKTVKPEDLVLFDPQSPSLEKYEKMGAVVSTSLNKAVDKAGIILLAVKPQVFPALLPELKKIIKPDQLVISIAAGIPIGNIKNLLGNKQPVIRVMPNLCAMVGESMSVWVCSKEVTEEQELTGREILQAIGKEIKLGDENLIDAATAVSGSGPAYVFYLTELLESNAREMGFDEEAAGILARQTVIGSAKFLAESDKSSKELRMNVTSKGGTTEAAFKTFDEINLRSVFNKGVRAAWYRSKELRKS